jgi:hypothetical protein
LKSHERRRELIRAALEKRLRAVCESIRQLRPADFGEHERFVYKLQAKTVPAKLSSAELPQSVRASSGWLICDSDCLESLRRLSLGEELPASLIAAPPAAPFLSSLYAARRDPLERFRLLVERYGCPLNIAADSEQGAREHLLECLMVRERAQVESGAVEAAGNDDLLLKLNLLAVYAALGEDLRYLDALNYYYELFITRGKREGGSSPLFASYLGLYAHALYVWLNQQLSE